MQFNVAKIDYLLQALDCSSISNASSGARSTVNTYYETLLFPWGYRSSTLTIYTASEGASSLPRSSSILSVMVQQDLEWGLAS